MADKDFTEERRVKEKRCMCVFLPRRVTRGRWLGGEVVVDVGEVEGTLLAWS